ncbi:putative translationally-controlled tumor protein [Microstroma glucosiphilum]|uniref:Translationally-controlled tumor protein homolog n=1 Tax=Pseudomicrostroma glucosiphilum TaxID=1684307 RepID=A0A316U1T2_9BASI|nr:putative translationally-controlled tumor protein [Pseudomicrostroma glucosiphilum]PWN19160.1 putative translationally-controlled tumor protein [Pseudomicrostroma glucosiphilum]
MKLFIDKISGDEMGSDAYDYKEVDDIVYELDAQQIVISEGDVDIGGNPSAEEQAEALENGGTQVINIVHSFRLQSTTFDKKGYLTHLKSYMKAIKESLAKEDPERVPVFEKKAAEFAKKIVGNFKDYDFYVGESMNLDGMVALVNYREDGVTPFFILWKDGLKVTKI